MSYTIVQSPSWSSVANVLVGLILYEYCLTFSEEVECIWRRPVSGGTVIFLLNRYVTLLYRTLRIIQLVQWTNVTEDEANKVSNGCKS